MKAVHRILLGIVALSLSITTAIAQETWQRGSESGVEVAVVTAKDGTSLAFFCAPAQEAKLAFMILKPGIMNSPIQYDYKAMEVRFVIGAERFDLPGKAEDGEIYVEMTDYNLALQFNRILQALGQADRAWVSIPTKRWNREIPVAGAQAAFAGLLEPCQ